MIILVQGYNQKKNKSVRTAAEIAGFLAVKKGEKTLVIDLINPDLDTPERMLYNIGGETTIESEFDLNVAEDGIDSLMRQAEVAMLSKDDFDNYATPLSRTENRLDVATITKNSNFAQQLRARVDTLKIVIKSAERVYDNVVIVLETSANKTNESIKEALSDMKVKNVYCLKQGFPKSKEINDNDVVFVVTDYDAASKYSFNYMKNQFLPKIALDNKKKIAICKVTRNTAVSDAALGGTLLNFIHRNKELLEEDENYEWIADEVNLLKLVTNSKDIPKEYPWEDIMNITKEEKVLDDDILEVNNDVRRRFEERDKASHEVDKKGRRKKNKGVKKPLFRKRVIESAGDVPIQNEVRFYSKEDDEPEDKIVVKKVEKSEPLNKPRQAPAQKSTTTKQAPKAAKSEKPEKVAIKVEGVAYPTLKAAADAYGLPVDRVRKRLNAGWTIKKAFELV